MAGYTILWNDGQRLRGTQIHQLSTPDGQLPTIASENTIGLHLKEPCRHETELTAATTGLCLLHQHSHEILAYHSSLLQEISLNQAALVDGFARLHPGPYFDLVATPAASTDFRPAEAGQCIALSKAIVVNKMHSKRMSVLSKGERSMDLARAAREARIPRSSHPHLQTL